MTLIGIVAISAFVSVGALAVARLYREVAFNRMWSQRLGNMQGLSAA